MTLIGYLAAVQFASDAFAARDAATPGSLPTRLSPMWARSVFDIMDRVAPAPFVEETLARDALLRSDPGRAERYALRLPPTPERNELLARVAEQRGQSVLALEYFFAAPDIAAVRARVDALGARDPRGAIALEGLLRDRLEDLRTHPDAVAEAEWRMGILSGRQAQLSVDAAQRALWSRKALEHYGRAIAQAPLSAKYGLSAANQAYAMGDVADAANWYRETADADPASADAAAGLGLVALERGRRSEAERALLRARSIDARAPMVLVLERALHE